MILIRLLIPRFVLVLLFRWRRRVMFMVITRRFFTLILIGRLLLVRLLAALCRRLMVVLVLLMSRRRLSPLLVPVRRTLVLTRVVFLSRVFRFSRRTKIVVRLLIRPRKSLLRWLRYRLRTKLGRRMSMERCKVRARPLALAFVRRTFLLFRLFILSRILNHALLVLRR